MCKHWIMHIILVYELYDIFSNTEDYNIAHKCYSSFMYVKFNNLPKISGAPEIE
jgi:hypothetical protein